jgi:hypothetical protein
LLNHKEEINHIDFIISIKNDYQTNHVIVIFPILFFI